MNMETMDDVRLAATRSTRPCAGEPQGHRPLPPEGLQSRLRRGEAKPAKLARSTHEGSVLAKAQSCTVLFNGWDSFHDVFFFSIQNYT